MVMGEVGRLLIGIGILLVIVGGILWLFEEKGLSFPRLPGDIVINRPGLKIYFPLGTSILISLLLSFLFYLFSRLRG